MHENSPIGHHQGQRPLLRILLVVALVLAAAAIAASVLVPLTRALLSAVVATPPSGWMLRDLMVAAACVVADAAIGGLAISGVATALAAAGQGSPTLSRCSRLAPRAFRQLVLAACGTALVLPLTSGAANADTTDPGHSGAPELAGLPLPDLPIGSGAGREAKLPTEVVRPGDSLWSISARLIGSDAESAQIANYVADLYALNSHLIGPDPDLILPGTELTTVGGTR